jgi:gluconolactonase
MGCEAVYRIDPDGTVTRVLTQPDVDRPNGLGLAPDGRTLYVVDSHGRPSGKPPCGARTGGCGAAPMT